MITARERAKNETRIRPRSPAPARNDALAWLDTCKGSHLNVTEGSQRTEVALRERARAVVDLRGGADLIPFTGLDGFGAMEWIHQVGSAPCGAIAVYILV